MRPVELNLFGIFVIAILERTSSVAVLELVVTLS